MPLIIPIDGKKSSALYRDAPHLERAVDCQPMRERRPSDDLAELRGMMALTGRTVSALGEIAVPPVNPSTLNKAWNRLLDGRARRPIGRTMESLRRGLRAQGYKDSDWLATGTNLRFLTIALKASAAAAETIRPETAPSAATVIKRIMDRLASRPDLSDEAAEAVAEALAQELRIDLTR